MARLGGAAPAANAAVADDPFVDAVDAADAAGSNARRRPAKGASSSSSANHQATAPKALRPLSLFAERLDWGLVIPFFACAGLLGAYILNDVQPFQRSVSVADRTIAMPVVPKIKQMPGYVAPFVPAMVLLGASLAAEFLPLLPSLRAQLVSRATGGNFRPAIPALAGAAFIRNMGGMLVALCATACMTEFMKVFCGRPRPDYLSRCVPKVPLTTAANAGALLDDLVLSAGKGPVVPVECTGLDRAAIIESRKSFPSGHSSSASSVGLWGAMYVLYSLRRVGGRGGGTVPSSSSSPSSRLIPRFLRELAGSLSLLLMLFFLAWPWGVGATRFVDNRHHPSDIVGGILLGAFMTLPFFLRFAAVSNAWDARDAKELSAVSEEEKEVGGGNGAAIAPAVATQV
jgi:membrane-associated phospholipid phosphatase